MIVAIVMAGQACGSGARPAPVLRPVVPVPLVLGMNDGGHTGVPRPIVDRYCATNRELVIRAAVSSDAEARVVWESLASCPRLQLLLLVEHADLALVRQLITEMAAMMRQGNRPLPWGLELGNELDLAGLTPSHFSDFIAAAWALLRNAGYRGQIITGGIFTVDNHQPQDFEEYLRPALVACPDCVVGLHWYGDSSDAWLARVQALGRDVAVTEFGMPACTAAQEIAQLAYFTEKLSAFRRTGNVVAAIPYQRLSAPAPCDDTDASHLAHFGLERPDGSPKPAVAIFGGAR